MLARYLHYLFDLQSGKIFADVLSDLSNRDLRIGIHVQGFASGGSESFVNHVPDASIMLLLGPALLSLGLLGRRRRKSKE